MKKLLVFCFVFLLFGITPKPALATECPATPIISTCNLQFIMQTNVQTLGEMLVGELGKPVSANNSATGIFTHGIGLMLQTPPVSTKEYFAYVTNRFHIPGTPTSAFAADGGAGFSSLSPVVKIWVVMRNLAYFVFAIFFVIAGIMIMIRSKIDPKTAATIQSVLPKIVISLLLVSFSYAIAGLLIDFMYVALGLVLTIAGSIDLTLLPSSGGTSISDLGTKILSGNIFTTIFQKVTWDSIRNASYSINLAVQAFVGKDNPATAASGQLLGFLGDKIGLLIIALAIVWALFQTWLKLLSAYANILLGVIMSPVRLMFDALPGQNQFESWIREMLSNLMAFPAVLAMILIGMILANTNSGNTGAYNGFVPPLIGDSNQQAVQSLIGIAIILTIPKTLEMLQQVLKAPKNAWGSAWNEAVGASAGFTGALSGKTARGAGGLYFNKKIDEYNDSVKKAAPGTAPDPGRAVWLGKNLGYKGNKPI